ncbi:MAG TPA: hypothetical protein VF939_26740 [Puia sp.]
MSNTCYVCSQTADSKEHTPARCFFPDDAAYRKNLITVPSCKLHNEDTSKDDKYVRNIITMSVGNNAIAFNQFINKTVKSFSESPALLKTTTGTQMKVFFEGQPVTAIQIDRTRFDKIIKKISYALFYHEHSQPWKRELIIMPKNLFDTNMKVDEQGALVKSFEKLFPTDNFDGDNPEVFKYSFLDGESKDINDKVLRIIFYEGFHVWVSPVEESTAPQI